MRYQPPIVHENASIYRLELKELICTAFNSGMSPIEIARVMGNRNPNFVYDTLRKSGMLTGLRRGKPRKVRTLAPKVADIFAKKCFTLAKWCNMWAFSIEEVAKVFSDLQIETDKSMQIHVALHRDFPDEYSLLFPQNPANHLPVIRLKHGLVKPATSLKISINYDPVAESYVARTNDDLDIVGYGRSWGEASGDLEKCYWIYKSLIRLNNALAELRNMKEGQ